MSETEFCRVDTGVSALDIKTLKSALANGETTKATIAKLASRMGCESKHLLVDPARENLLCKPMFIDNVFYNSTTKEHLLIAKQETAMLPIDSGAQLISQATLHDPIPDPSDIDYHGMSWEIHEETDRIAVLPTLKRLDKLINSIDHHDLKTGTSLTSLIEFTDNEVSAENLLDDLAQVGVHILSCKVQTFCYEGLIDKSDDEQYVAFKKHLFMIAPSTYRSLPISYEYQPRPDMLNEIDGKMISFPF